MRIIFLVLALTIGAVLLGNTPVLMRGMRLHRKCYHDLVPEVWREVGERPLYFFGSEESIRGCVPFYGNRPITILPTLEALQHQLAQREAQAVMIDWGVFQRLVKQNTLGDIGRYTVFQPKIPGKADDFAVLLSKNGHGGLPKQ